MDKLIQYREAREAQKKLSGLWINIQYRGIYASREDQKKPKWAMDKLMYREAREAQKKPKWAMDKLIVSWSTGGSEET